MTNILKLKNPMMHGSNVRRLQENLDDLGFDKGPNDGIFGPDTELAVKGFQDRYGLVPDGIVGPITRKKIMNMLNRYCDHDYTGIVDIRGKHIPPKLFGRDREWTEIDSVVLHQTGCKMPSDPRGWNKLNAHCGITETGAVVLVNDPAMMIWHAQGLSKRSIGIEIAGNYPGIEGNQKTLWKGGGPAADLTQKMVDAYWELIAWIDNEMKKNGSNLRYLFAHRQSSKNRMADPGGEIWRRLAIPTIEKYGLTDIGDYAIGSGRPIPREWDEDQGGKYWK